MLLTLLLLRHTIVMASWVLQVWLALCAGSQPFTPAASSAISIACLHSLHELCFQGGNWCWATVAAAAAAAIAAAHDAAAAPRAAGCMAAAGPILLAAAACTSIRYDQLLHLRCCCCCWCGGCCSLLLLLHLIPIQLSLLCIISTSGSTTLGFNGFKVPTRAAVNILPTLWRTVCACKPLAAAVVVLLLLLISATIINNMELLLVLLLSHMRCVYCWMCGAASRMMIALQQGIIDCVQRWATWHVHERHQMLDDACCERFHCVTICSW
jgi:hypothetical protein